MAPITQMERVNQGTGESGRAVTVDERRYLDSGIAAVWHFRRASRAQLLRGALNLLGTLRTIFLGISIASPLAVYALDYPGVPLLLIDFRDASHPQSTERRLRAANDVTTGILGLTPFGSFRYFAAKTGSDGIMLPTMRRSSWLSSLERFETLYPVRIDLELGRALNPARPAAGEKKRARSARNDKEEEVLR